MSTQLRALRPLPCLLLLAAIVLFQSGCAQSDADLDYQRDKPAAAGDHSYHGWNNANY
jgi:hypothetical protein